MHVSRYRFPAALRAIADEKVATIPLETQREDLRNLAIVAHVGETRMPPKSDIFRCDAQTAV